MPKPPPALERKTLSASFVALIVGAAIAALNGLQADSSILGDLPATYQTLILSLVPALVVFLGGYLPQHTTRPDLEQTTTLEAPPMKNWADPTVGLE